MKAGIYSFQWGAPIGWDFCFSSDGRMVKFVEGTKIVTWDVNQKGWESIQLTSKSSSSMRNGSFLLVDHQVCMLMACIKVDRVFVLRYRKFLPIWAIESRVLSL
jgi:hypothetical protein